MGLISKLIRLGWRSSQEVGDYGLLELIRKDPPSGWRAFLERYSGQILAWIRDFGFDHDESMERFVYVCERLAEDECRRLREVRHLGERGELVPWLRQVVRHQLMNWMWSHEGRPRLLKAIEDLGTIEQEAFRLHFWEGLTASEIHAQLLSKDVDVHIGEIYLALDRVHQALSSAKRWRLISRLSSLTPPRSFEASDDQPAYEPVSDADDPERVALAGEAREQLRLALVSLTDRERLIMKLRFDDSLETREIAELLGESPATIRRLLRRSLQRLRQDLTQGQRLRSA